MHARAQVFFEAGQTNLGRLTAASNRRTAFDYQNLVAGFRHVGGADQAVVARSGHDDIEALGGSSRLGDAMLRERERRNRGRSDETAAADITCGILAHNTP